MTPRTPSRRTIGHEVANVARALGQPFMPWQQHWSLVAGELVRDEETGIWVPAYPEVFDTVMRQNGKTLRLFATEIHRALLWEAWDGKPQALARSGQSGSVARQKFRKEHWPLIKHSPFKGTVEKKRFAAEDTGIDFKNGAILTLWASAEGSGHSLTIDFATLDEIWADTDDRREQAVIPAMATRHDSQKQMASTGGTQKSTFYLRKQKAGRAAVDAGKTSGMAYIEFSADDKARDFDPEDPRLWRSCMPALGHTITERTVQAALDEMRTEDGDLSDFCRAWLNITKREGGDRVIPDHMWAAVTDPDAAPSSGLVIAVDAQPDQAAAAIAVADEHLACELIDHRAGVSWLLDRLDALAARWNASVVVDTGGPVGYLADQLKKRSVDVIEFGSSDVFNSAAALMDEMEADPPSLRIRPHPDLTAAVEGAAKEKSGDRWKWSRKSIDVDISPLVAVTFAVGHQLGGAAPVKPFFIVTT